MLSLNLVEYIRQGMIFKNLQEHDLFDAIVYEQYDNPHIPLPKNTFVCTHHGSALASELLAYHHQFDRLLIIIDRSCVSQLMPFFEQIDTKKKVTIGNLGTGMSGLVSKGKAELHDIDMLQHLSYPLTEAFDFVSFFTLLETPRSSYIRLSSKDFGGNIFKTEHSSWEGGYIDLRSYGLSGGDGTIVMGAGLAHECIPIIQALPKKYDGFIQTHYFQELSEQLLESIESTKKLLVIGDYAGTPQVQSRWKAQLKDHGLAHISCTMLCPLSHNINSLLLDVIYEQAGISPEKLAERIAVM